MDRCQTLPLRHLQMLSSLTVLRMFRCGNAACPFIEGDGHVDYQFPVKSISIYDCSASGKDLTQLFTFFPKLTNLALLHCENITGLAVNVMRQQATPGQSSSANKVDAAIEQQKDARAEEEIVALAAEEGLLLLPPQLEELLIHHSPDLSLLSNPLDDNKEDGRTRRGAALQDPSRAHEQVLPSHSSKLQHLTIDDVARFTAMPISSLLSSSLTTLKLDRDHEVELFTKEQEARLFVNSLEEITIRYCRRLQYLPARLHSLPCLKRLNIWESEIIRMLPKDGLPSTLQELDIYGCPEIRLPKDCLPSSLQKLVILDCPTIRSLPKVDDLPTSLRELEVHESGSKELRKQCHKLIGIIP
ncbi:hypothetical protein C2845_PM05G01950 [Panicum miliaceum]|uniref:Uncharacterized protein n=1 Tax=Panicum miliaceum TaxID=4540 RepID=A0A3L6SYI5_PANMI|nr:hypothetical protein C2845_PM05G01950 [Panicum miliaceum]